MRVCIIGDSIINGTGDDDGLGWVGPIVAKVRAQGREITYYNLGIRRNTSADIAARWRDEIERRLPPRFTRRLAFSFGSNDCVMEGPGPRVSLAHSLANAETMLGEAAAIAPTLMIGPAPVFDDAATDDRVRALSQAQQELCARIGVPFLAVFDFVVGCEAWRRDAAAGDGAHPNRAGYSALADFIWQWPALHRWFDPAEITRPAIVRP